MKIHWGRIIIAGLVAEILGVAMHQVLFRFRLYDASHLGFTLVGMVITFILMLLGALWVARQNTEQWIAGKQRGR
jgi:hypothetical protein